MGFDKWLVKLAEVPQRRVLSRLKQLGFGYRGDHRHLGKGLFELRLHTGPGYRVYFRERDNGSGLFFWRVGRSGDNTMI